MFGEHRESEYVPLSRARRRWNSISRRSNSEKGAEAPSSAIGISLSFHQGRERPTGAVQSVVHPRRRTEGRRPASAILMR